MTEQEKKIFYHPGDYLADELKERDLSIDQFSEMSNIDAEVLIRLVAGVGDVTPQIATKLADALGTTAELWLNLQREWGQKVQRSLEQSRRRMQLGG